MTEPTFNFPPEAVAITKQAFESHRASQTRSIGASTNFHEKLAVLTAGSLALAVSGAGALYQKPLTNPVANRLLFESLAISVVCLWISLISSVLHNFLESYALHLDSKADFLESSIHIFGVALSVGAEVKDAEGNVVQPFKGKIVDSVRNSQHRHLMRSISVRNCEMPLSSLWCM
jgi:hypothetical protein